MIFLLACAGGMPPDGCDKYRDVQPETYGYCLARRAPGLGSPEEVEQVCGAAGQWEEACRQAWVVSRLRPPAPAPVDVLRACGGSSACALDALDVAPHPELATQLNRCHQYAGTYTRDCVGHSFSRWMAAGPSEEAIATARASIGQDADGLGAVLGLRAKCGGIGDCSGDDEVARACADLVRSIGNRPHACDGAWPIRVP